MTFNEYKYQRPNLETIEKEFKKAVEIIENSNDLDEVIYNLTNNGNIVMIYVNYGEEENFCQLYLPDKVKDEQLKVYEDKYANEINKVNVYLSGVDGDVFKDTEIYKPGEFNIEEHINKSKSR